MNKGQGLIEYMLIFVMVAVVVIVILAILGQPISRVLCNSNVIEACDAIKATPNPNQNMDNKCSYTPSTFECKDYELQKCLKSDKYSHDDCMKLIGSGAK